MPLKDDFPRGASVSEVGIPLASCPAWPRGSPLAPGGSFMHIASKTLVFGILSLVAAACGSGGRGSPGGSSTGGSTSGPSAEQACKDQVHASCTLRDTCSPGYSN